MGAKIDLMGRRFNRLLIIGCAKTIDRRAHWECLCDCGKIVIKKAQGLLNGSVGSCGCYKRDLHRKTYTKHGHALAGKTTPEYVAWNNIINRCYNPKNNRYHRYGGRGIKVCDEWYNSFEAFLMDMGLRPSRKHSVDRIENDGDYTKNNCVWATIKTQCRNKSTNRWIEGNGKKMILKDWARKLDCSCGSITKYLDVGLTMEWVIKKHAYEKEYRDICRGIQKP